MNPPASTSSVVDVIILTAISLEFDAVVQVTEGSWPGSEWIKEETQDGLPIAFRAFRGRGGQPLQVAVAQAGDMGSVAAAVALSPLVDRYQPSCIAMTGVCAGRPTKTNLGDVVAADRLFFHDTGKELPTEVLQDIKTHNLRPDWKIAIENFDFGRYFQEASWLRQRPIPYDWQENWVLVQLHEGKESPYLLPECSAFCPQWEKVIVDLWRSGHVQDGQLLITNKGRDRIRSILIQHRNTFPDLSPSGATLPFNVYVAPIGSGNKVVEDKKVWGFVSSHMRKTLGIEMEAGVIGEIALLKRSLGLDQLVMKGVMDFADHGRDDHFKGFAARASAECLIAFLRQYGAIKSSRPMAGMTSIETIGPAGSSNVDIQSHARALPQKVLSIQRPPPRRKRHSSQAESSPAQRVAVAALLAHLIPDENVFRKACAAAAIPAELFWAASSASDRWFSAVTIATQAGVLRPLLDRASSSLPPDLRWRLELIDSDAILYHPRWDREDLYDYRLALAKGEGNSDASHPDLLGLSALRRIWGFSEPELAALRRYLDETEDEVAPLEEDVNRSHANQLYERDIQLGLAADHLFTWCDSVGGENLITWVIQYIDRLSPARFALIAAVVHWWDLGRKRFADTARSMRDQSLDLLSRESINAALSRLSSLDRLLCEADAVWWGPSETPPSVRLAIRASRSVSIASMLEAIGERRPSVFIEQIRRNRGDQEAVVALARGLRRLRMAGLEGEPMDPELTSALRGSLPEATTDEINAAIADARKRALWLQLLSPPLSYSQIEGLIEIHANARRAWERDRARRWLCTTLEPMAVWQRLASPQREQWVEELTAFELRLVSSLLDRRPPDDASERNAWTRLHQRAALAEETYNDRD